MGRQMNQLDAPAVEERVAAHKKRVRSPAHNACEGRINLAAGAGVEDLDLQSDGAGSWFHVSQRGLGIRNVGRIDKHGHASGCGHQLMQELQPLCHQLGTEEIDTSEVAARSGEAGDETEPDRVFGGEEDDRNRGGRGLGRQCHSGAATCYDHGDRSARQISRQRRNSIKLILGPSVFGRHVLALNIAGALEALAKCAQTIRQRVRRSAVEEPNHRHRRLRVRRKRPRSRRSANERDEIAPFHSIT